MENMLDKERELSLYLKCFKYKVSIPVPSFSVQIFECFYYLRTLQYSRVPVTVLFEQNLFLDLFVFFAVYEARRRQNMKKNSFPFPFFSFLTFPYYCC
jgi:hypothetical protein